MWLLNTINSFAPITREDINRRWYEDDSANSDREREIPLRTFQKSLKDIADYFEVDIVCNRSTNEYSVEGGKVHGLSRAREVTTIDLANKQMQNWETLNVPLQLFRIDALPETAERLREHPICKEQREVSVNENGIAIFDFLMKPTWQWYEAIRSLGAGVKVLHPYWLSELLLEDAQGVVDMYKEDKEDKPGQSGFINPYICHIVDVKKSSLYLSIPQDFYDAIQLGLEDAKEYNVIVNPENIWHLIQLDLDKDEELRDEEGNAIPVHYDTIHFKVGHHKDAPEMIVEIEKAEVFELSEENGGSQRQYVTDENGEVLIDHDGNNVPPKFDEQGNCINGKLWNEEVITYTLGKVLQTWAKE